MSAILLQNASRASVEVWQVTNYGKDIAAGPQPASPF